MKKFLQNKFIFKKNTNYIFIKSKRFKNKDENLSQTISNLFEKTKKEKKRQLPNDERIKFGEKIREILKEKIEETSQSKLKEDEIKKNIHEENQKLIEKLFERSNFKSEPNEKAKKSSDDKEFSDLEEEDEDIDVMLPEEDRKYFFDESNIDSIKNLFDSLIEDYPINTFFNDRFSIDTDAFSEVSDINEEFEISKDLIQKFNYSRYKINKDLREYSKLNEKVNSLENQINFNFKIYAKNYSGNNLEG
jgi:hypothetical protein